MLITHASWSHCSDMAHRPVMKCSLPDSVMLRVSSRSKPAKAPESILLRDGGGGEPLAEAMSTQEASLCPGIPLHMLRLLPSRSGRPVGTCESEIQRSVIFFA